METHGRAGRVKKVMNEIEGMGQIHTVASDYLVGAVDLFARDLVVSAANACKKAGKKRMGVTDLRAVIDAEERFDFLRDVQVSEPAARMSYKRKRVLKSSSATSSSSRQSRGKSSGSKSTSNSKKKITGSSKKDASNKEERGREIDTTTSAAADAHVSIYDTGSYFIPKVETKKARVGSDIGVSIQEEECASDDSGFD